MGSAQVRKDSSPDMGFFTHHLASKEIQRDRLAVKLSPAKAHQPAS